MKKTTRWKLDTCGCIIEFEWDTDDDGSGPYGKVLTPVKVIERCFIHEALGVKNTPRDVWNAIRDEQDRKNILWAMFQERYQGLEDKDYEWYFDASRVLHAGVPKLKLGPGPLSVIQDLIDLQFGAGRVIVK